MLRDAKIKLISAIIRETSYYAWKELFLVYKPLGLSPEGEIVDTATLQSKYVEEDQRIRINNLLSIVDEYCGEDDDQQVYDQTHGS